MPAIDVTKPEIIKFLIESYEKTAELRIRWNIANKERLEKAAQFTKEERGYVEADVARAVLEAGMPALVRENISAGTTKNKLSIEPHIPRLEDIKKDHSIVNMGLGDPKDDPRLVRPDDDLSFDPVMRPVPPEQQDMVYKGLPDYGRKEYMKVRNRIKPEEKYYFQECEGWQYGWRLKDSYFGKQAPIFPHRGVLQKALIGRTGPKPDPVHYKSPEALLSQNRCLT